MDGLKIPEVSLKEEDLLAEAENRAGSSYWGADTFKEALRMLLRCIEEEAQLSRLGRFLNWRNMTRVLTNRLLIEQDKQKRGVPYPESCEQQPIFIIGVPRSGTTILHNLIIQDPQAHYVRLCDGMYPFPQPSPETWQDPSNDPRVAKTEKYTTTMFTLRPEVKKVHYIEALGPEECLWLFEHQFIDPIFAHRMEIPSYAEWLFSINHEASYAEYHQMLNLLALHFPHRRWVLKAPRHIFFLDVILKEFPQACIIWTHRDPVKVVPSMASLSFLFRQSFSDATDALRTGAFEIDTLSKGIQHSLSLRDQVNTDRIYDLRYPDLMTNPVREVQKIYEYFHLPVSPGLENALLKCLQDNPQNKFGKHTYSPEDFGLTSSQIKHAFKDYSERFAIPEET